MKKRSGFEIYCDLIDDTRDGTMPPYVPDFGRRQIPGPKHYLIDGVEVSQEEFERRFKVARESVWNGHST